MRSDAPLTVRRLVRIPAGPGVTIEGELAHDETAEAPGVVLFAHGSGSSRHSPRNNFVADPLREGGAMTLLVDLLTREEDQDLQSRFDIALLTDRLAHCALWLQESPLTRALPIGLFGASTGAAAALQLAARRPAGIAAVVSRGGRPDLAGIPALERVRAPTLLIVGGRDTAVIELNRDAYQHLACEKRFVLVPGATHLFEEPGTLERVAEAAREWFAARFKAAPAH